MLFAQHIPALHEVPAPTRAFGYDAVRPDGRRQTPVARSLSEDDELRAIERRMLKTSTTDLQRNFAIAAWAIRKHLDYVSTFRFQCRSGNDELDEQVERMMREWGKAENCDAGKRLSHRRMTRMTEARRTLDGDVGIVVRSDKRLQIVESDRIFTPYDLSGGVLPRGRTADDLVHGVLVDKDGAAESYAVHRRRRNWGAGSFEFERMVPARFMRLHGYFDRYDQVRGISPLAAAVNTFRDVYEGFTYALAKAKVSQLLAFVLSRGESDAVGANSSEENGERTEYKVDFGKGPVILDLDAGDKAEMISDDNPSDQFQAFTMLSLMVALKALDIPLSLFDESHTAWSGQRQALLQYEMSADQKREDNRELLDWQTDWRIRLAVMDGEIVLPKKSRVEDIRWQWVSRNVKWIDPLKEITADIAAVAAGFASPQMIVQGGGNDWYEIVDQIAEAREYAASKGITFNPTMPNVPPDDPEPPKKGKPNGK